MHGFFSRLLSAALILHVKILYLTCRYEAINDPRQALREAGESFIVASLHAHQLSILNFRDKNVGALVSRSRDGNYIAALLESIGVVPIRGSRGATHKGGATALMQLIKHVNQGDPAIIAVDGPKGPRGHVQPGISVLARKTETPVFVVLPVPSRRLIIKRAWDRLQIPLWFARVRCVCSDPIYLQPGESDEDFRARIEDVLRSLEEQCDPVEAASWGKTKPPRKQSAWKKAVRKRRRQAA